MNFNTKLVTRIKISVGIYSRPEGTVIMLRGAKEANTIAENIETTLLVEKYGATSCYMLRRSSWHD